ncbi:hypothetical protein P3T76_013353 [Phytophthora citrophthora]|uniref:Uncharacterized protein n=1 Tax=Phytophthora citrophthora TaxID=4793 RepID=A0AAD9LD87_9STRA|nr:hypothetical protein P3T76_013353 [Phytophthora citrophthora]
MPKRVSAHDLAGHGGKKVKLPAVVVCEYCEKQFSSRGIKRHQTFCKSKKSWMEAHTPRSYKFCILTELVFENILSFMNNQTLTKMQMITGDHYQNCEPDLAKWCCKCENNNLTTSDHRCRECEFAATHYSRCVGRSTAYRLYGVKDFSGIEQKSWSRQIYNLFNLEEYMLQVYGSKMAWLREVAGQRVKREEAKRKKEERQSVIDRLDPDFQTYFYRMVSAGISARYTALERGQTKFEELKKALTKRGLPPEPDFQYCSAFITTKSGNLNEVVDNMEEKHFLFTQTKYAQLSGDRIDADHERKHPALTGSYQAKEISQNKIKADLCVQYLLDNKRVTIPQKWEKCRQSFDKVVSENLDPKLRALYIYLGEMQPPAEDLETP